jgi:cell division protein FtsB
MDPHTLITLASIALAIVVVFAAGWAARVALMLGKMSATLEAIRNELAAGGARFDRLESRVDALESQRGTDAVSELEPPARSFYGVPRGGVLSQP